MIGIFTHHVIANFSNLEIREDLSSPHYLLIDDKSGLSVISSGSTSLVTPQNSFVLNNVLYSSRITKNLPSIPKFAQDNSCFFEFHHIFFTVKDLHTH